MSKRKVEEEETPLFCPLSHLLRSLTRSNCLKDTGHENSALIDNNDIPIFTAEFESELLCEPHPIEVQINGARQLVQARPCVMNDKCQGLTAAIPGRERIKTQGLVLMEAMSPEEYTRFMGLGELPATRRVCILCARYIVTTAYLLCTNNTPEAESLCEKGVVLNYYCNPKDCENGYQSVHMIPQEGRRSWNCMVGHMVRFIASMLSWEFDPHRHIWRVNQHRMLWVPPFQRPVDLSRTSRIHGQTKKTLSDSDSSFTTKTV